MTGELLAKPDWREVTGPLAYTGVVCRNPCHLDVTPGRRL